MPFTAIRRLQILPPIFEVTLICLASSLADVLSSRPAAFVPLPHTRLPAIVSAAYSRTLEGSSVASASLFPLPFDRLSHMYASTVHTQWQYSSRSRIQVPYLPFPLSSSSRFTYITGAGHLAVPSWGY
ncbi:hypothetical protein B0H19DRAFT_1176055, partial [Mycena capillaripes]